MIRWIGLLALLACEDSVANPGVAESPTSPVSVVLTDEQRMTLDAADLYDGTADQVIAECTRCSMMMPGSTDHSSQVGDYTLHFCAASCKAGFDANPEQGISDIAAALAPAQ